MRLPRHPLACIVPLALVLATALSGCGGGGDSRPRVETVFPATGAVLTSALQTMQITYTTPVTILNENAISVTGGGFIIPVNMEQRLGDERSIFITPRAGAFFPTDAEMFVSVIQGAVINEEQDYALDAFLTTFTNGPAPSIWAGTADAVVELDPTTLAIIDTTSAPAGTEPAGIADTQVGTDRRVWVLVKDPIGSSDALAHFAPGAASMTAISLPTTSGDITVAGDTMVVGPRGIFLYVAYLEDDTGLTRLARIDLGTRAVDSSIVLSVAGGAGIAPLGLAHDDERDHILVSISDTGSGHLVYVDIETFTEIDQDAVTVGVQARAIAAGAGAISYANDRVIVALTGGTNEVALVTVSDDSVVTSSAGVPGSTTAVATSHDRAMRLQTLDGFAPLDPQGLVVRQANPGFTTPTVLAISDDTTGAAPTAAAAVVLGRYSFEDRYLIILDNDVATLWTWDGNLMLQDDLDDLMLEINGVDLASTDAAGIRVIGRTYGAIPD